MILGALVIVVVGVLVVNYFKDQDSAGQITETATESQTEIVEVGKIYQVTQNENLWEIAERAYGSGYNWVDIAEENNLSSPNLIYAGQELTIPDVEPKTTTIGAEITETTYEVVAGDNLWNIAIKAYGDGLMWNNIAEANNLTNPDIIHTGNILILPR